MAGRQIDVPRTVEKIGYPYPANTLDFLALGMGPKIAVVPEGVQRTNGWGLRLLTRMGYSNLTAKPAGFAGNAMNPEAILLAGPQIIFADTTNKTGINLIGEWGIAAVAVKFQLDSIDDCVNSIEWLASNFGDEDARKMAENFRSHVGATLADVEQRLSAVRDDGKPTVLLVNDNGNGSYTPMRNAIFLDNVRRAGGRSISSGPALAGTVGPEQILAWDPDIILLQTSTASGLQKFTTNDVLGTLRSVKGNRVFPVIASHGGRMENILSILYVAKLLHPDQFIDIDLSSEIGLFHERFLHVSISSEETAKYFREY